MTLDAGQVRDLVEAQAEGQGGRDFAELASEIARLQAVKEGAPGSAATWLTPEDLEDFQQREAELKRQAEKAGTELRYFHRYVNADGSLHWRDPEWEVWPADFRVYLSLPREQEPYLGTFRALQQRDEAGERRRKRRLQVERAYRELQRRDPQQVAAKLALPVEEIEELQQATATEPALGELLRLEALSIRGDAWRSWARERWGEARLRRIEELLPEDLL